MVITPQEITRCRSDFRYFCRKYLKIKPKRDDGKLGTGGLIPFVWNTAQELVWETMEECIRDNQPIQIAICKARQIGISTLFMAWSFWRMWRANYIKCGLSSAQKSTYLDLVEMMNIFYDNLPDEMKPKLRSPKGNARVNLAELEFVDQHCKFSTGTAKADAFRGSNIDVAICTEVSSYADPEGFFDGFIACLSESPLTTFILESSPKDGWFWSKYNDAKEGLGGFKARFLPWWILPNPYSKPLIKHGRIFLDAVTHEKVDFDNDEKAEYKSLNILAKKQGFPPVTYEQMYWRKLQIEKKEGDVDWYNTEYPRDDVSCFMRSTSSAFKTVLDIVRTSVEKTMEEGFIAGELFCFDNLQDFSTVPTIEFVEESRIGVIDQERTGGVYIFAFPQSGYTYTMGVDVAAGLGQDTSSDSEHAASVACVYCCDTKEQVAEYRSKNIDPYDLADEIAKLGYFYNTSMICVEINNVGRSTVDRLGRDLSYPCVYQWPKFDEDGALSKKRHWDTNEQTKPIMIDGLRYRIRLGHFIVRSYRLYDEMISFVVKNGRYKGTDKDSDCIIAASLAWQCVEQTPFKYVLSGLTQDTKLPEGYKRRTTLGGAPPNLKPMPEGILKAAHLNRDNDNTESYFVEDIWGVRSALT